MNPEDLIVEEAPKPKKIRKQDLVVVEYFGDGDDLAGEVEAASKKVARDGVLIVSVPKAMADDTLFDLLKDRGFDLTTLNVLTNPALESNDGRTRAGWICRLKN